MTQIKQNGAKVPRVAQLLDDQKRELTQRAQDHEFLNESAAVQQAIDALLSERPDTVSDHVIAPKALPKAKETQRRRIYASSISNTLTHAGVFIAIATTYGERYSTNIPRYALENLREMRDTGYALVTDVDSTETAYKYAVAFRMGEFDGLAAFSALIVAEMQIGGISKETIEQARFLTRKLRGGRKVAKDPNDPTAKYNSVSQTDYDNQVANFERLIYMAAADPYYEPTVEALTMLLLETKLTTLRNANNDVMVAKAQMNAARIARNEYFNTEGTGLVSVFINAKNVVLTNFGRNSEQFRQVSGLGFRKIDVR